MTDEDRLREHARIELARREVVYLTKRTFHKYVAESAHYLISHKLSHIIHHGETDLGKKNLMIFAPPQHGKSEMVGVRFPCSWFGHRPDDPVLMASYSDSLVKKHSEQSRECVRSDEYREIFPHIELGKKQTALNWQIANTLYDIKAYPDPFKGELYCTTIGGQLTGHGGLLGIIDDPFKDWAEAQSTTVRENVWNWYTSVFLTRLWEGANIVIIMTRWHKDDLCGRLLKREPGKWDILRLPAIAETKSDRDIINKLANLKDVRDPLDRRAGEPLCPKRFSLHALMDKKTSVGGMVWAALYQGAPTDPEGNKFKRAYFQKVGACPKKVKFRCRYWDNAATDDAGCNTAGIRLSVDYEENIYLEHCHAGQWSSDTRDNEIKSIAQSDKGFDAGMKTYVEEEPGSSGKDAIVAIIKKLRGYPVYADRPTGSKDVRLEPFAAQCEAKNVYMVEGNWNESFVEEMIYIPNGDFRDRGDACAGAYAKYISIAQAASTEAKPDVVKKESYHKRSLRNR